MKSSFNAEDARGNGWFTVLGIVMILTGIGAFAFPMVASLSVELLVGVAFLVGGIATLFQAFQEKEWGGVVWLLAIGIVYVLGGIVFLANPFGGLLALTVFLGMVFVAEGLTRLILGLQMRDQPRWGLLVASGLMSIVLGVLVFSGIANGASLAFIGVLVGINFIFAGSAFVALGSAKTDGTGNQAA
ncbi:HdeD family acid-resistance protein [Pseudaestuariivita atlantica]|nr:HdeD family acid-resistance protein [Pseudaestuariivita atlantica]